MAVLQASVFGLISFMTFLKIMQKHIIANKIYTPGYLWILFPRLKLKRY